MTKTKKSLFSDTLASDVPKLLLLLLHQAQFQYDVKDYIKHHLLKQHTHHSKHYSKHNAKLCSKYHTIDYTIKDYSNHFPKATKH